MIHRQREIKVAGATRAYSLGGLSRHASDLRNALPPGGQVITPNRRSPRVLIRRERDERIRGLPRTLHYHPTKAQNFAQQLHLGQVS